MTEKLMNILKSKWATLISGLCLLADLIPHLGEELGFAAYHLPFELSWVTVFISGIPLLYLALWRVVHNNGISKISSALLITVAMIAAIWIGDLFAAGEVAFIMAIGEMLEDRTTDRAKRGLKKLISLAPTMGRRIANGKEESVAAEEIRRGDILRILPGETVPVDGIIVAGESSFDQSVMTGESLPVDKTVGDSVFCGTQNRFGSVDIEATQVGVDSSLQKLIRMVKDAEDKKAPMARIADRWASFLVPVALLIAIVAGIVTKDIVRAVTVLVVFCPCALVLATPTAIMAAIGQATKHGVIIKSGEALEKMGRVDTVAFDKTGTLTQGVLEISDACAFVGDGGELLSLAASAEERSEHPIGRAIVAHAKAVGVEIKGADGFRMDMGKGVSATVDGAAVLCGTERFLEENGVFVDAATKEMLSALRAEGKATVIVAKDGACLGVIALADTLRKDAPDVIRKLHAMKVDTVLLTGDNSRAAGYFSRKLGIKECKAELLPEQKLAAVEELGLAGKRICMIGDGVNDAPALKSAYVGVAMGSMGSDIAVEAADIALMSDDISKLPYLKRLALATVRTIKLSISLSMAINFAAVALSVLGWLNPTTGALVHNAGSCFVVLIAALLYDRKFKM